MPAATLNATTDTDHCNIKLATVPLGETVALYGLIKRVIRSSQASRCWLREGMSCGCLRYVGHARSHDTAVHPVGTVHSTAGYSCAVWETNSYRHSAVMSGIDTAGFSVTRHTASNTMYVLYTAYIN